MVRLHLENLLEQPYSQCKIRLVRNLLWMVLVYVTMARQVALFFWLSIYNIHAVRVRERVSASWVLLITFPDRPP